MSQKKTSESAVSDYYFRSFGNPILGQTTDQTQINTRLTRDFETKQACNYYFDDPRILGTNENHVCQRPIMTTHADNSQQKSDIPGRTDARNTVDYYMNDPSHMHTRNFVDRIVPINTSTFNN